MSEQLEQQVAVFQVGQDLFAVDILQVREIARFQKIRRIPRSPEFLEGVIDLRGEEIVPIVDLHKRLGLEPGVREDKSRIIVAPIDGMPVGFWVDAVRDVSVLRQSDVEQPPAIGSAPAFLEGVIRTADEIILLLDINGILSSEERLHMEELRLALADGNRDRPAARPGKKTTKAKPRAKGKTG